MQLTELHKIADKLQLQHGHPGLKSIYGAGCIKKPQVMFVFMNPTAKNVAAFSNWKGLRAPWLGTKNIWQLLNQTRFLSDKLCKRIRELKTADWTVELAAEVYEQIAKNKAYITNLAKCTQIDARPLKDKVFKEYLEIMHKEIELTKPEHIIAFGNQVSSILLNKIVSVSHYKAAEYETLSINNKTYRVYPCFYPVGQGQRNLPLAVKRIKTILAH